MWMQEQARSSEWLDQWSMFEDREESLLHDWISPYRLENFTGKTVLECGCGGGHHTRALAGHSAHVTAVDLNTAELARRRCAGLDNVTFVDADLLTLDLGRQFDVVVCIGVIHHTDNPDRTFESLYRHCKPGGILIVWTYSSEGNALVRYGVEPLRKLVLRHLPRSVVAALARAITTALYLPVHTVYRLPVARSLPYFEYFRNFRRLSFGRNVLNVFDKLNAPQTHFTTLAKARQWMSPERFEPESISIRPYVGVSYTLTGVRRTQGQQP